MADAPADPLDPVLELLRRHAGLTFPESRVPAIRDEVRRAMRAARARDTADFVLRLGRDEARMDAFLARVTVGETYFFRDPAQWRLVRDRLLPEVRERRGPTATLRAWSAGCATGEEPYTLGIVCHEAGMARRIVGTDVSRARLAHARAARYGRWSLRMMATAQRATWFVPRGEAWELRPALRDGVEFRYGNLAATPVPERELDLVLCRNALFYLTRDAIDGAAARLVDALAVGGWLVLGANDPPLPPDLPVAVEATAAGLVYRRVRASRGRAAAPPVSRSPALRAPSAGRLEGGSAVADAPRGSVAPLPPLASRETPWADGTVAAPVDGAAAAPPAAAPAESLVVPPVPPGSSGGDGRPSASSVPPIPEAAAAAVRALADRGALADARDACLRALERFRSTAELHYLHALVLHAAGRDADALEALRPALYLAPELAVAHLLAGAAHRRLGARDAALRSLRQAERALAALPDDATVPASGGETAGALLASARTLATLVEGR